jgi:GNAT superfamily N-acetyltransferase
MRSLKTLTEEIVIRTAGVDDEYILDYCPWNTVLKALDPTRPSSQRYREFNAALQNAYGGHAVTAWDGDRLVGVLTFSPDGAIVIPPGIDYPRPCAMADDYTEQYLKTLNLSTKTGILDIGCVSVYTGDDAYRRKRIATHMVLEAMAWADGHGYLSVRAMAMPRGASKDEWERSADPGEEFWESMGFEPTSRTIGSRVEMVRYSANMPRSARSGGLLPSR